MAAFIKSLSRLLGNSGKQAPAVHLAAFGKHPGWNEHLDDLGLDTDALINAKRLLYVQGISQNIDSGAWDKLEPAGDLAEHSPQDRATAGTATVAAVEKASVHAAERLEQFQHDFLWHMPGTAGDPPVLLAGRLWSSSDGKGRAKYPMVLCSQITDLPDRFATAVALPFLADVHQKCLAATTADTVRRILQDERENLRARIKETVPPEPLTPRRLAEVARHSDMLPDHVGFDRIVYQFASGLSVFRAPAGKSSAGRRSEKLRLPICGMPPGEALLFWLRFTLTFVDASTQLLLIAPDQGEVAPWVDLIAGEPTPADIFCIKAGTKSLPLTSDIPYTLDPALVRAIDGQIAACESAGDSAPLPPWPMLQ